MQNKYCSHKGNYRMKKYYFRTIIIASGLLLAAGCISQFFQAQYYIEEYEPIYIAPEHISEYEDKYFIAVNINEVIADALNFTRMRWKDDAESKGIFVCAE